MNKKGLSFLFLFLIGMLIILTSCSRDGFESVKTIPKTEIVKSTNSSSDKDVSPIKDLKDFPVTYYPEGIETSESSKITETDNPLIIADFGPNGELPSKIEYPSIWVLFSEPIVPLSALGLPSDKSDLMKIDPPLKGVYRWYGTKLLSFESSEKGLPQHIYTVDISDNISSLGGKHLSGRNNFSFHTGYLSMLKIEPGRGASFKKNEVPVSEAGRITVTFNYPVNLEVISKYLSVSSGGKNYEFDISRPKDPGGLKTKEELSKIAVLDIPGELKEDSTVSVIMLKGAKSETDYIGAPEDMELSFKTISPFTYVSSYQGSHSYPDSYKGDSNTIFIKFSHPVKDTKFNLLISSIPDLTINNSNITVLNNIIKISNLDVEYNKSYTFYLSPEITDIYGRKLGKTNSIKVEISEAESSSWFPNLGTHMLESSFEPKIIYGFQNIFDGDWKVDSILDPYSSFSSNELTPYDFSGIEKNIRHFEVKDLRPWLSSAGTGYVGLSWNFEERNKNGLRPAWGKKDLQIQVTDLAITTRYGYNKVVAVISRLSTGEFVKGAKVSLMRDREIVKQLNTDQSGLCVFYLDDGEYSQYFSDSENIRKDHIRFKVETDTDSIEFIPNNSHNIWNKGISNVKTPLTIQKSSMETLLFTDRGLYRPGETVTFRGIDKDLTLGEYSSFIGSYKIQLKEPSYTGKALAEDNGSTSDSGGFYGTFHLSDSLIPGNYRLVYSRSGGTKEITFQVANFERVLFSVNLKKNNQIYLPDQKLSFSVLSTYLSGGVLSNAVYSYAWIKTPVSFRPEGIVWDGWSFGPGVWDQKYTLSTGEGTLDSEGRAVVEQVPVSSGIKGLPYRYSVEVRVRDKSNQEVARRQSAVVHPASFYIGMKLDSNDWSGFLEKGASADVEFALVDPLGGIFDTDSVPHKIKMELFHKSWKKIIDKGVGDRINTDYKEVEELETSSIITDSTIHSFKIKPSKSGSYIVRLSAKDYSGRDVVTNLSFYSTGGDWIRWGKETTRDIKLESDKVSYKPGETAKLLIKSPLPEGKYLITTEREGIFDERIVYLKGSAQVIGIPIEENYVPVVYIAVSSWSKRAEEPPDSYFEPDPDKPKGYFGITSINIDPSSRTFDISMESDKTYYKPGDEVKIKLIANYNGFPLEGAEITLMAVDRDVLNLINYHVPDPVSFFYSKDKFPLGIRGADSRSILMDSVIHGPAYLQTRAVNGGSIDKRDNFNPTAVFEPYLITNSRGEAFINFTLPDNLTTYRLTAIGVKDDKFGLNEIETFARNPINAKSLIPETLRYRDLTISGISLTNLSENDEKVSIKVSSDILTVSGSDTVERTVSAGKTEIINFYLSASKPGKGTVSFSIRSDILNENLQTDLTVTKPYVTETFTTAGQIIDSANEQGNIKEKFVIPSSAGEDSGSLSVTLSPGFCGELSSAVAYLSDYPYNCFEQISSKLIPKIIFKNNPVYITEQFKILAKYQNPDGGIPFWPESGYKSSYYVSLRVALTLSLLQENGITIDIKPDIKKLLNYLNKPDEGVRKSGYLMAFKYYVLSLNNKSISAADALLHTGNSPGISGYALLGLAYAESGNKEKADLCLEEIKKFIKPGTRTIDITETSRQGSFYGSDTENLALLTLLLSKIDPEGELLMRTANTLSLKKRNGYWRNTVDTSWAILALSSVSPNGEINYNAEVDLADENLLSVNFKDLNDTSIRKVFNFSENPLKSMDRDTPLPFSISRKGPGNLFYTASLKYNLPSEILAPGDEGIGIYSSISDPMGRTVDVSKLVVGKTYVQKIIISSTKKLEYLSLRVPIPSGARILDASLDSSARYSEFEADKANYWTNFPRKEIMDNEVRYFFDSFEKGKKELKFYFRARSSGIYPTPPIQAECMYEPEIFGRTAGKLFVINKKE